MKVELDLCKLFGVKEGQEFRIGKSEVRYIVENNKLKEYSELIESFTPHLIWLDNVIGAEITIIEKYKLTQDTYNFLKTLKENVWIVKDGKTLNVGVFENKPIKKRGIWILTSGDYHILKSKKDNNWLYKDLDFSFLTCDKALQVKDILSNYEIIKGDK